MKLTANRIGWIFLHIVLFGLACAGTMATFFMLALPIVLIGLPLAIFAKSRQTKSLAITAVMGSLIWIPVFLIFGK
jgi:hypothetical protein